MPVAELLERTSSAELTEWMAYEHITGPLGPERADLLHGVLTAVIANANRGRRGRTKTPSDFIPKWDRIKKRLAPLDMLGVVRGINSALGGTVGKEGQHDGGDRRTSGRDRSGRRRPGRGSRQRRE